MLDYSLLISDSSFFKKTISKFDVRVALIELLEIQEDKLELKNIEVQ